MSEIVDIVATVIDQLAFKPLPGHGPGECQHCDDDRELTRKRAREILAAIRKPTPEMIEAGGKLAYDGQSDHSAKIEAAGIWRAMIDEALK